VTFSQVTTEDHRRPSWEAVRSIPMHSFFIMKSDTWKCTTLTVIDFLNIAPYKHRAISPIATIIPVSNSGGLALGEKTAGAQSKKPDINV
jgi:hypothetical protein